MLLTKTTARSVLIPAIAMLLGPLFVPTVAQAQAPPGSYLQSCTGFKMSGTTLLASCKDSSGNPHASTLPDAWTCIADITNSNGQLQCQGGADYKQTCTGITTQTPAGAAPRLVANCKNFYGQYQSTTLLAPDSCNKSTIPPGPAGRILNINGNLRCVVWFAHDPSGHGNQDIIGKTVWTDDSYTRTYWTIDQPIITQPTRPYPPLSYEAEDYITLWAGGCSQAGGHGSTWYSYVEPIASSGEYWGMAFLPGTGIEGTDSQFEYIGTPNEGTDSYIIPGGGYGAGYTGYPGHPGSINGQRRYIYRSHPGDEDHYLTLGYIDDGWPSNSGSGYPDNGYYAPDGGEEHQCPSASYTGPAWVMLQVDHPLKPAPAPYSPGSQPFDVIYNQIEANGLPLNPEWFAQKSGPLANEIGGPITATGGLKFELKDFSGTCGSAFSTPSQYDAKAAVSDLGGAAAGAELGSFAGPVGTVVGAIGGWLFGSDVVASTATTMDTTKLEATCTTQSASMDQFSSTTNWGSAVLAAGNFFSQICPAQPIRGHLNWQPVTYTGLLHFSDWSGVYPQDYDINMSLLPGTADDNGTVLGFDRNGNSLTDYGNFAWGLTQGSQTQGTTKGSETYPYGGLLVEFDSQETVQPYFLQRPGGSWWNKFAMDALAAGPGDILSAAGIPIVSSLTGQDPKTAVAAAIAAANQLMGAPSSAFAVNAAVTGLMGIDGVHTDGISELHPVFSMAIHIPPDETTPTGKKEHWAFFIRNHGDEGNCSAQSHTLEPENYGARDYYISLPWPSEKGKPRFESVSNPSIKATPWVDGASVQKTQSAPGVGTYLHFLSPSYSAPDPVPFFGFDGEVTLEYKYAKSDAQKTDHGDAPARPDAGKDTNSAPQRDKNAETFDAEDFPRDRIIAASKDPAVTAHLKKFLTPSPASKVTRASLPDILENSEVQIIGPRLPVHDARLPRRTRERINVKKERYSDDLYEQAGFTRRKFQAIDSQHVFFLGDDGVLRFKEGPFNFADADSGKSADTSKLVDRDVQTFEAVSQNEVLKLGNNGALFIETAPFGIAADGRCAKGYVWREAYTNDHVCVSPRTHDEAAADNAAAPRHVVIAFPVKNDACRPGYVWRQANETDHVCVLPDVRSQTASDNILGPSRIEGASLKKFFGWPVVKVQAMANGGLMVLDANGKLFSSSAPLDNSHKPALVALDVRAFQPVDSTHTLILSTDDRLQSYPIPVGSVPKVYEKVWAFQQTSNGTLFVVDEDDTLWNEQTQKQIETNVHKVQAIDSNALFILKTDGTLSLRTANARSSNTVNAPVASGARDFQALDAQTVFVLDEDGKLWLEHGNFGPETPAKSLVATNVR